MKLIHKIFLTSALILLIFQLSGCGETVSGIGKDAKRIGHGIKTIFVRE